MQLTIHITIFKISLWITTNNVPFLQCRILMSKSKISTSWKSRWGFWENYFQGVLEVGRKSRGSPIFVFDCILMTKFVKPYYPYPFPPVCIHGRNSPKNTAGGHANWLCLNSSWVLFPNLLFADKILRAVVQENLNQEKK